MQWIGGYATRFLSFFVALSFFRFDGESRPTLSTPAAYARAYRLQGANANESRWAARNRQVRILLS